MPDSIYFDIGQSIKSQSEQYYKIVQLLGSGANSVAFLVLATSGQNRGVLFTLKVFRRLSASDRRSRFLQETEFLKACAHPAIVRVYDSGVFTADADNIYPFVVSEYLPLRLVDIVRVDAVTVPEKICFAMQLLSALCYLSTLRPAVVHRDIKPQNIFIKGKSCVLGDFGLMKLLNGQERQDRTIFKESMGPGMPFFYRTPDLVAYARNEAMLTVKTDVFQLGLVLTELFTGWNPCRRTDDFLSDVELAPMEPIRGNLGALMATFLKEMLVIDPSRREAATLHLDHWQTAFQESVKLAHALEGRVM